MPQDILHVGDRGHPGTAFCKIFWAREGKLCSEYSCHHPEADNYQKGGGLTSNILMSLETCWCHSSMTRSNIWALLVLLWLNHRVLAKCQNVTSDTLMYLPATPEVTSVHWDADHCSFHLHPPPIAAHLKGRREESAVSGESPPQWKLGKCSSVNGNPSVHRSALVDPCSPFLISQEPCGVHYADWGSNWPKAIQQFSWPEISSRSQSSTLTITTYHYHAGLRINKCLRIEWYLKEKSWGGGGEVITYHNWC